MVDVLHVVSQANLSPIYLPLFFYRMMINPPAGKHFQAGSEAIYTRRSGSSAFAIHSSSEATDSLQSIHLLPLLSIHRIHTKHRIYIHLHLYIYRGVFSHWSLIEHVFF